jgi:hypothetical protein
MTMSTKSPKKLEQALIAEMAKYPDAVIAAVYQWGHALHAATVPRVPFDTGRLRNSGYVAPPTGGKTVTVEVGFGTVYARRQHYELTWRHPKGGEALYLQKTLDEMEPTFVPTIARLAKRNAEKGITAAAIPATAPTRPEET